MSVTGLFSPEYIDAPWTIDRVQDLLRHLWLPMIILGLDGTARLARIMRANLLDELNKPYVEMARAKGLSEWKLVLKYPVRLAINPLVSTIGWYLPLIFLRQRHRGHGFEPAHHWSDAAAFLDQPGYVPGRNHYYDLSFPGHHRHPHIRYSVGVA